jgi:anti-anti-sigma regulatory factor
MMTVNLPAELTIAHADRLRAALLAAFDEGGDVAVNAAAVTDIDAAGLQVLCAARKTSLARKQRLAIVAGGRSAAFVRAVETAGLGRTAETRWMAEDGVR